MKQQQEAERLAREAKKKAEEEAAKREKQKKLEMERQKREQERLRKEEEKRHKEEERLRKEEEKKRRIREEKERAAEKERKRKEKEEKERAEKEKIEKAKAEKEEKERLEREKAQKAKAEKEERDRLEQEKAQKAKAEKEERDRLKREADAATAAAATKAKVKANTAEHKSSRNASPSKAPAKQADTPVAKSAKTPSPPPGITAPTAPTSLDDFSSDRQQVLIDALVGSGRPNFNDPNALVSSPSHPHSVNAAPIRPPSHLQPPPFMPSHLDILQGSSQSSSLLNASPIDHTSPSSLSDNSPSMLGMFNNRVTSPLEPSSSSRRSITPIAPIGQPINGRRVSSVPAPSNPLHDTSSDPIIAASNVVKRPSVASPFDSTEPRSFFSSFLFGEPRNTMMPMNEYDTRFAPQQPSFDRRFSTVPSSQPMQPNWTNGWTATSALSDNVHGKLFGDALVSHGKLVYMAHTDSHFVDSLIVQPWHWKEPK